MEGLLEILPASLAFSTSVCVRVRLKHRLEFAPKRSPVTLVEGVAYDYNILKEEFSKTITATSKMFEVVKRDGTRQSLFAALNVLENEERLKEFKGGLSKLKKLYETIAPDPVLFRHMDEYTWLIEINEAYNKLHNRMEPDLAEYEEKTKKLIREKLIIGSLAKNLPVYEINSEYLKKLEEAGYSDDERAMEMRQALEYTLRINLETNPIYETLSQRLERILKNKDKMQLLKEMAALVGAINEVEGKAKKLGLSKEEFALLSAVKKYVVRVDDAEVVGFVKELQKNIKSKLFPGWHRKVQVLKDVEREVFDRCFRKFSGTVEVKIIASLSEELVKYLIKYNP